MSHSTPESRLLLAELRAGRPAALRRLRLALRSSGGSVEAAARSLGVGSSSLYRAAEACSEVRRALDTLGMGRQGAALGALRARGIQGKTPGSEKSTGE